MLPFTVDQFFEVFADYNQAIWPMRPLAYLLAVAIVIAICNPSRTSSRFVFASLAILWLFNAVGYHWLFFAEISAAAILFAALFLIEAALLGRAAIACPEARFRMRRELVSIAGLLLIAFALAGYPAWGWLAGHAYPAMPMFGVAPCPTTIFTAGVLLTTGWRVSRWLLIIPAIWSVIGGSAAVLLSVPQDTGLIATGVLIAAVALSRLLGTDWIARAGQ